MIAGVVKVLTGWKGYAAAALASGALLGGAVWTVQGWRLDASEAQRERAEDLAALAEAANQQCAADVDEARLAVGRIMREAEDRARAAAAAVAAAQERAAHHEAQADYWRTRQPAVGVSECAAVDELLQEYRRGRQ